MFDKKAYWDGYIGASSVKKGVENYTPSRNTTSEVPVNLLTRSVGKADNVRPVPVGWAGFKNYIRKAGDRLNKAQALNKQAGDPPGHPLWFPRRYSHIQPGKVTREPGALSSGNTYMENYAPKGVVNPGTQGAIDTAWTALLMPAQVEYTAANALWKSLLPLFKSNWRQAGAQTIKVMPQIGEHLGGFSRQGVGSALNMLGEKANVSR